MYNIALRIKVIDWLYILLIGVLFASVLSSLGYLLLGFVWHEGALFGSLLGFSITLFSLICITFMNQTVLPKVDKILWLPFAIFFSFLSGFLGSYLSVLIADAFQIKLLPLLHTHLIYFSISVGALTYIVGALLYRFVKMRNEKEQVDRDYIQSRLGSLETQLNSHFLFNALNSVAELIHQDPNKAETAVLKISTFLRNTMDEKALIGLDEEIRNVKDYIELENIRFADRIKLDLQGIPLSVVVPKFSLQLIVENAIKHGMIPHKELLIEIRFDKDKKQILITNNGKEMKTKKFSTGLGNLNQRLKMLCQGYIEVLDTTHPTFILHLGECYENTDRR